MEYFFGLILYLVCEESKLLQEVLHQLEFVSDCVFLHLSAKLLGLLAHAVLQEERGGGMMNHTNTKGLQLAYFTHVMHTS